MRIFIAGPYGDTNPRADIEHNIEVADAVGREFMRQGFQVYIPHKMSDGWESDNTITLQQCLELDKSFIKHWAEALVRIPGYSKGADGEVAYARSLGLAIKGYDTLPCLADIRGCKLHA